MLDGVRPYALARAHCATLAALQARGAVSLDSAYFSNIRVPVSLMDTAPAIARLLRVAAHGKREGRCAEEIFETGMGALAPAPPVA
jgi:hypothetical protein